MSVDDNFMMVKRFDVLHLRFLLHLQSSLAELQKRLDACDDAETAQLNLSSTRDDNNQERKVIIDELEQLLPKYGLEPFTDRCCSFLTRIGSYTEQASR